MVKETVINGQIFLEQTTYYCYRQGDTREKGTPYLTTSSKEVFNQNKRLARKMEKKSKTNKP
jgi:hypothetical protein